MDDDLLVGWKAIADFLNRRIRTLQRWRAMYGLPVRGAHAGPRAPVQASKSELRKWLDGADLKAPPEPAISATAEPPGMPNPASMLELLELYYPEPSLREHGLSRFAFTVNSRRITTHIATKPAWLGLAIAVDERDHDRFPLCSPNVSWPPTPKSEEDKLRGELERKGITFRNNPTYCLHASFTPRRKQVVSFWSSQYVDYKIGLGRLEEETIRALRESGGSVATAYRMRKLRMKGRNKLLPDVQTILSYNRLCAGGTNVLMAFRRPSDAGFVFFMKQRSKGVSTGRQLLSLVPSGMHQPTVKANAPFETSIAATVYREAYEELFGGKEVEADDQHIAPLWFMGKPPLKWIAEHREKIVTEIVSFGLNLMDGTYEFGVLVLINDESYWQQFQSEMLLSKEFDDSETPMYSTMDASRLASLLTNPLCADTSLIALVEGLWRLKTLAPDGVMLPHLRAAIR